MSFVTVKTFFFRFCDFSTGPIAGNKQEIFTDADAFVLDFPKDASVDQKGIILGMGILINSVFYEGDQSQNDAAAAAL
jgi:Scramblase